MNIWPNENFEEAENEAKNHATKNHEKYLHIEGRSDDYKENQRVANYSTMSNGSREENEDAASTFGEKNSRTRALDSGDHISRSRKLHNSHFCLGSEEDSADKEVNKKFVDRYANKSLEGTNVVEKSTEDSLEKENSENSENPENSENFLSEDKIDLAEDFPAEEENSEDFEAREKAEEEKQVEEEKIRVEEKQEKEDKAIFTHRAEKLIATGISDHAHFETEKSLPWMRLIPGDKNLSEPMFLYLAHDELKRQIKDLEKRENQASSKHQWDEALRLRDMRNRLDLAREKNLYNREDLMIDAEMRKNALDSIDARQQVLNVRERLFTNSAMYSEEAKVIWQQWVQEDVAIEEDESRSERQSFMKALEENWRSFAVEDKRKILDAFKEKEMLDTALRKDHGESFFTLRSAIR